MWLVTIVIEFMTSVWAELGHRATFARTFKSDYGVDVTFEHSSAEFTLTLYVAPTMCKGGMHRSLTVTGNSELIEFIKQFADDMRDSM